MKIRHGMQSIPDASQVFVVKTARRILKKNTAIHKNVFQLNANRPLVDSMIFILNKFEHVEAGRGAVQRGPTRTSLQITGHGTLHKEDPR